MQLYVSTVNDSADVQKEPYLLPKVLNVSYTLLIFCRRVLLEVSLQSFNEAPSKKFVNSVISRSLGEQEVTFTCWRENWLKAAVDTVQARSCRKLKRDCSKSLSTVSALL
ncbi:hypothetical protein AVEN_140278-1 [Araneus ventricosus]|uniref:Uncharacterized protein n=1 Tax=Araneus ventricosus TaxID=182803 RepID=A0A4Y2SDI9_ARAVE|nr:hypothetical protein AVEN_140278-1 [Araneus ventricosus]